MTYTVTLYQDEDGWFVVECPGLPGCMSQGSSREEALENIKDAIKGWLHVAAMDSENPGQRMIEVAQVDVAA